MEVDLHNLTVSHWRVKRRIRSNLYRFGVLSPNSKKQHGQCNSKVDFKQRVFEPRDDVKGKIARINFYMADRYDLRLSDQQQKLFIAWSKQYPVTPWELERDRRIARVMGHHNEFVTGKRTWRLGHRNSREGIAGSRTSDSAKSLAQTGPGTPDDVSSAPIHGNRNSKIFSSQGCSSYNAMSPRNVVNFSSEEEAVAAGLW